MKLVFGLLVGVPIILLLLALYVGDFFYSIAILLGVGIAFIALIGALGRQVTKRLRGVVPYRTGKMICVHCGADRKCIAYGSTPTASPSPSQHTVGH